MLSAAGNVKQAVLVDFCNNRMCSDGMNVVNEVETKQGDTAAEVRGQLCAALLKHSQNVCFPIIMRLQK